jgi:hypothetical protein
MKLSIYRADYKNPNDLGLPCLPTLNKVSDITDINEIDAISAEFDDMDEAKWFVSHFPKYLKLRIGTVSGSRDGVWYTRPIVSKSFNTFWMNGTTKEVNETAVKNRNKMIEILDNLS